MEQNTKERLANKTCMQCKGDVSKLSMEAISALLIELNNDWTVNGIGHLYKAYKLNNFADAMNLANQIAELAEREAHHPHLIIAWGLCAVEIWTHKVNGLTESDFILAAKINKTTVSITNKPATTFEDNA